MKVSPQFELPADRQAEHDRGVKLAWATIAFLLSAIVLQYFIKGNSQAVKNTWIDDMLALVPPVVFLISSRYAVREPNDEYPFGYHRAPTLAFLASALSLLAMGLFLFVESALKLVRAEHPSVGTLHLFGETVWLAWPVVVVMAYKIAVGVLLGRAMMGPAERTNNKVLHASADMLRADWLSSGAAAVGVVLVGFGWWWADPVAALVIAVTIVMDGLANCATAAGDILDRQPRTLERRHDPLPEQVKAELERSPLVRSASVRLREAGQVLYGEAVVRPWARELTSEEVAGLARHAKDLDWRIQDFTLGVEPPHDDSNGGDSDSAGGGSGSGSGSES